MPRVRDTVRRDRAGHGSRLIDIRKTCAHGEWLAWLKAQVAAIIAVLKLFPGHP
jgi:hypothetical protein